MDIKTLETTPTSVIISMHINNFVITYGEDSINTLAFLSDYSIEYLEMLNESVGISKALVELDAGVRLMYLLKMEFPGISTVIKELYKAAV